MEHKKQQIMAATNWTIIRKYKENGEIHMTHLMSKWTYKTALGIAQESTNNEKFDLICIIETNKIITKDDEEQEKKSNI